MPVVPFSVSVPANGQVNVDLSPFDRFGGRGGRVGVRATVPAASAGVVNITMLLGSDTIVENSPLFGEPVVGSGPSNETPAFVGVGAPADPITIRLANTTAGAIIVSGRADIENI